VRAMKDAVAQCFVNILIINEYFIDAKLHHLLISNHHHFFEVQRV
jgi:hypothetical protein